MLQVTPEMKVVITDPTQEDPLLLARSLLDDLLELSN